MKVDVVFLDLLGGVNMLSASPLWQAHRRPGGEHQEGNSRRRLGGPSGGPQVRSANMYNIAKGEFF